MQDDGRWIQPAALARIVARWAPGIHRDDLARILGSAPHDPAFRRALAICARRDMVDMAGGYVLPRPPRQG